MAVREWPWPFSSHGLQRPFCGNWRGSIHGVLPVPVLVPVETPEPVAVLGTLVIVPAEVPLPVAVCVLAPVAVETATPEVHPDKLAHGAPHPFHWHLNVYP